MPIYGTWSSSVVPSMPSSSNPLCLLPSGLFWTVLSNLCCFVERRRKGRGEKKMMALVSRQGRQFQRYTETGGRLVVGCIPYRINMNYVDGKRDVCGSLEVLVVSSQKGRDILFPKGGWENDESSSEAALREAYEEAGVHGHIEGKLGEWEYKSRSCGGVREGIMFPLYVTKELSQWPEKEARQRKWVTVAEAREGCPHKWMREALDELVKRLSSPGKYCRMTL